MHSFWVKIGICKPEKVMSTLALQSKEEGKYQELIQSNTTPNLGHHMEK